MKGAERAGCKGMGKELLRARRWKERKNTGSRKPRMRLVFFVSWSSGGTIAHEWRTKSETIPSECFILLGEIASLEWNTSSYLVRVHLKIGQFREQGTSFS